MGKGKGWQDKYKMIDDLGKGGNAKVYRVKCNKTNQNFALKELVSKGIEKKGRFVDEIHVIKSNYKEISGIIPILDFSIDEYWYVMPIAKPIINYITKNKLNVTEIVKETHKLCETLEKLHEKGISHRDIKPSNIYYYEGKFCLGDFGLVDFQENENAFTKSDKGLGAIFTIAPEMKRDPKKADGKKADVFSLAKTIWMFLTIDEKGFDGVYNYLDESHSLRFYSKYKDIHLVEIDELLKDATANDPNTRPTIKEFKERLQKWLEVYFDKYKSQLSDWGFLNKLLFRSNPPDSCVWKEPKEIVDVLNVVGLTPAFNHMLFSDKGGLDFSSAKMAAEDGCIKIYDTLNSCYLLKPKCLHFEAFKNNFRWNYFLLEIDSLKPILETYSSDDYEYLVEDNIAHYVSAQYANYGVYDYETGVPLPEGFQKVYRRYTKGTILIVMKIGPYNGIHGAYDGRHGDCSANDFREYIEELIKSYDEFYKYAKQEEQLKYLSDEDIEETFSNLKDVNKNPFKNNSVEKGNGMQINQKSIEQKKSKEYIERNFFNWNFQDVLQYDEQQKEKLIKFVFMFQNPNKQFSLENVFGTRECIAIDGNINKINLGDEECFCVYDRKLAIKLKDKIENKVARILMENDLSELEENETCFEIKIIKMGKPTHLFAKNEIKEIMQNADDRVDNQLVIDENGYAKIIKDEAYGYLYPVRHESWDAGNGYVGKYSKLLSLDNIYIASLQGWLLYLKTKKNIYMDYVQENTDEEELIEEIKKHY